MGRWKHAGFTLLEILVALFIFTILSVMLAGALHSVIGTQDRTEKNAERLRQLQFALLVMSNDIQQAVDRPVMSASGREEKAFLGMSRDMTLTHAGFSNPGGAVVHSGLQRSRYYFENGVLWRVVWPVLDQAQGSKSRSRALLENVTSVEFQYLDKDNHFHQNWPTDQSEGQALPKAVKISLSISNWGSISQLYVIPVQTAKSAPPPPKPPAPPKS